MFFIWNRSQPLAIQSAAPRRIDAAGFFEAARVAAPVRSAGFAKPLAHSFPFFAVGDDGAVEFDRFDLRAGWNAMDDRHDLGRLALRTSGESFLSFLL